MKAIHLNEASFKQKVYDYESNPSAPQFLGDKPVVVDFFATWCGPCKMMSPVVDELAEEYAGKVDIYKVDVDQAEELSFKFGIRSVPTFIFIQKNGQPKRVSGGMSKEQFKQLINDNLLNQ